MQLSVDREVVATLAAAYGGEAVTRQIASLARNAEAIDDHALWLEAAVQGRFHDMPIERVTRCACGSADIVQLSRFVFWNLLGVSECRACELVMTSPRLTVESMQRVFGEHYFDPSVPETWGRRRAPVFRDVLRIVQAVGARRVLDVGTAYGHFVKSMGDRRVDAAGTDISAVAVEWGRRQLGIDVRQGALTELAIAEGTFDCLVSLDALYYAPDPRAELTEMIRILPRGGHLVLRLRNGHGVARRARREGQERRIGRVFYPAEHLWSFTPATIARLLEAAGASVLRIEPAAYSATRLGMVQNAWVRIARALGVVLPGSRLLTQNFNVVARKQ